MKSDKLQRRKTWKDEDISFQTSGLTKAQQEGNLSAFGIYRRSIKNKISDNDKLRLRLLRLKYQINSFLKAHKSRDSALGFFLRIIA